MTNKETAFDKLEKKVKHDLKEWEILSSDELLAKDFPDAVFLAEKLVPKDGIMVIAGDPNSFKSWLMLWIAREIAQGNKLFCDEDEKDFFETQETPILWVDEEVMPKEIARRWKKLSPPEGVGISFMASQGFKLDNEEDRKKLLATAKEKKVGLVVFDSLRAIHSGNENDSKDAQAVIDYLHEFTREGITVMCSHHQRKEGQFRPSDPGQRLRGSTALWAGFNSTLSITASQIGAHEMEIVVIHTKLKEGEKTPSFKLIFSEFDGKINIEWAGPIETKIMKEDLAMSAIEEYVKGEGITYGAEVRGALVAQGLAARTVARAIKGLKDSGKIIDLDPDSNREEKILRGLTKGIKLFKWVS